MSLVEDGVVPVLVPGFTFSQFGNEPYNAIFFQELSRQKLETPFPANLCPNPPFGCLKWHVESSVGIDEQ